MKKYYAGIGSRQTPQDTQDEITQIASELEKRGYILRSGRAKGADQAFERGVKNPDNKIVYGVSDCEPWCLDEVTKVLPKNRTPIELMNDYTQKLLGRNMKIILGDNASVPVEFVICWTPVLEPEGGTGYGIRCAKAHWIPVYNLLSPEDKERFYIEVLLDFNRLEMRKLFFKKSSEMNCPALVRNQSESGAINEWFVFDAEGEMKDHFDVCMLQQRKEDTDEEYDSRAEKMHKILTSWIRVINKFRTE